MTRYQLLLADWKDCTRCALADGRRNVVFLRGAVPCDVLFVGEAPGESEDVIGLPFVGPAGKLQDQIVARALDPIKLCMWPKCGRVQFVADVGVSCSAGHTSLASNSGRDVRVAYCNLTCCVPREDDGGKTAEPPAESIEACAPHLVGIVGVCRPRLIVTVGKLPTDWLKPGYKHSVLRGVAPPPPMVAVTHPAAILRANIAQRDLLAQRSEVVTRTAVLEYLS